MIRVAITTEARTIDLSLRWARQKGISTAVTLTYTVTNNARGRLTHSGSFTAYLAQHPKLETEALHAQTTTGGTRPTS